jgi:hypothetical protein
MKRLLAIGLVMSAASLFGQSAQATAPPTVHWPAAMNAEDAVVAVSAPAAPSNLQASSVTTSQLTLTWTNNATDATENHVEGKTSTTSYVELVAVTGDSNGIIVDALQPSTTYSFRVRASNSAGFSGYSNEVTVTTPAGPTCPGGPTSLCLFGGRFQITATWMTGTGASGNAQVMQLTDDSGWLWFFSVSDPEALVKIIDGCSLGGHFWFFAGGLTNVHVVITVTDTTNGAKKTYTNPLNTVFQPIQDTSAFPCP